jgi:hypothetical protein
MIADGTDERRWSSCRGDGRMDSVRGGGEGRTWGANLITLSFLSLLCKGTHTPTHTPGLTHSATLGTEDLICCGLWSGSLCLPLVRATYHLGMNGDS